MSTKNLLTVIVAILIGIVAILLYREQQETPLESLTNDVSDVVEDIGDEIDENTTIRTE